MTRTPGHELPAQSGRSNSRAALTITVRSQPGVRGEGLEHRPAIGADQVGQERDPRLAIRHSNHGSVSAGALGRVPVLG